MAKQEATSSLPVWVPEAVENYLAHTEAGLPLRRIAQIRGQHASTILRQVRRIETRRDDALVDAGLKRLGAPKQFNAAAGGLSKEQTRMAADDFSDVANLTDQGADAEAMRVLRRMSEPTACLAVADDMEKAVVVRDTADGRTVRTAIVDKSVAEMLAIKEWIDASKRGRIARYRITPAGRVALKRLLSELEPGASGLDEAAMPFEGPGQTPLVPGAARERFRSNSTESPLATLARRREKSGRPFLDADLVAAGERFREDFELAQMSPDRPARWEDYLVGARVPAPLPQAAGATGPAAAHHRVSTALAELGPGLGDVALRCCCFLEGLESTEQRMGWSARSGKIVLRIALQRLRRHFDEKEGAWSPLIG